MSRHIAVYMRVSTDNQNHRSQEPDLQAWLTAYAASDPAEWYRDTFSGKTMDRPEMQHLEADIAAGRVSRLLVWRLDRLGRTAAQTLRFLDGLESAGVAFVSVKDGIDASTATGRLLRTILAGFAEYEREVISERVRAGIARAQAGGKKWGGRKAGDRYRLTPGTLESVKALLAGGVSKAEIARQLGIHRTTVYDAIRLL